MLLFMDSEFTGLRKDTTLISLGIVSEGGRKFYAEFDDYDRSQCNDWIKENVINNLSLDSGPEGSYCTNENKTTMTVFGNKEVIGAWLRIWLFQFDSIQFVSDVCHYDFVLLIDLLTNGGTALDLPNNISAVCHDLNMDIARYYGISEREAFDKSREEMVMELCGHEVEGRKHNALYDAEVIKRIYERIVHLSNINTFSDSKL